MPTPFAVYHQFFETIHTSFLFWVEVMGGDTGICLFLGLSFRLGLLLFIFDVFISR